MTRRTTRDAALSRLFGAEESDAADDSAAPQPEPEPAKPELEAEASSGGRGEEAPPEPEPVQKIQAARNGGRDSIAVPTPRTRPAEDSEEELSPGPSGYIGLGRYVRAGGVLERITPYVRPDQAEALRIAVARKRDPRGRDISQIVQTLLDEAGYRGPEAPGTNDN